MYKFCGLTTIVCSLLAPLYTNAQDIISLKIDGGELQGSDIIYIEKGITMVPLRMISEELGAIVNYDQETKQIYISKEENIIKLELGSNTAVLNDKYIDLPTYIISKNGVTMVPIRFICEALNSEVKYHEEHDIICINSNGHKDNCIIETDIVEAYMLAIDTIYQEDLELNHNIKYLAIDNSKMNYLSHNTNQELIKCLSKYNLEILEMNYDELVELELIKDGKFKDGILITIDDSSSIEDKLVIRIEKYKSSLGAISCPEMIIEKVDGEWKITSQDKWLMS